MAVTQISVRRVLLTVGALSAVALTLLGCTTAEEGEPSPPQGPTATSELPSPAPETSTGTAQWSVTASVEEGQIRVEGAGPADINASAVICLDSVLTSADYLLCDMPRQVQFRSGHDGSFAASIPDLPFVGVGMRREVDCRETACTVGIAGMADVPTGKAIDILGAAEGHLEWPADAAFVDPPRLTVSNFKAGTADHNGSARVEGTGFTPGSHLALVQCPAAEGGGVVADECRYEIATMITADEAGDIDVPISFLPQLTLADGSVVECDGSELSGCLVGDPWPDISTGNRYVMVPLAG